ncbi:N-6 DNA methylase (plasmid) [Streptomyces cellulosae]|uniref:Eco57I restriction-modification methylase domain-containing protein n=1 Tax=Streptomyces cellulosae TaxID=1968 RepID=UPI002F90E863|nr:N-6 DNA methylase [Streptomyces cellulosae]
MSPVPSARDYERLVQDLGRDVVPGAAVSWAHTIALVQHARQHGLLGDDIAFASSPDGTRKALEVLADAHPALEALADPQVVPVWASTVSSAAWERTADFWARNPAADDGPRVDGYVLGDAYQALSVEARKSRALCQTPPWIAELLLELALSPGLEEAGPDHVRMIDPSCGTGHILLAAFHSVRAHRPYGRAAVRHVSAERSVERALEAVCGVDLDPYAAVLARYRLLAATASVLGRRIDQVPASWPVQVACADSLLDTAEPLLRRGSYHAVVGNPPYITVADAGVRDRIRAAYPQVATGKFSLALPFCQLMFELALPETGRIAQLTTNAWMKREYGRRFVEEYLPAWDAQWIIDTSGCYIPGHGTPTVIMLHQARRPHGDTITVIRGNQGEPRIPDDPSQGLVWRAIEEEVHFRLALDRFRRGAEAHRRSQGTT